MWSLNEFERLVKTADKNVRRKGDKKHWWQPTTSLENLWRCLEQNKPAIQMIQAIEQLSLFKRKKYYDALKYVILNYPGNLNVREPRVRTIAPTSSFHTNYNRDRGDLVYGIHPGRSHAAYKYLPNGHDMIDSHRYCDGFNNFVGIGKGDVFKELNGPFKGTRVRSRVKANAKQTQYQPDNLNAYFDVLMGSRFAPDTVFSVPESQLAKDDYHSGALIEKQWMKSIRRACKAGILAVATHPTFVSRNARVHFILDGMGDLADVAQKKPLKQNKSYVSITSSELSFCCRKWDLPPLNLKDIVQFYVNAREVHAPWEQDWTCIDATGKQVKSGYQTWKRYQLYRVLLRIPLLMTNDMEDMGY